MVVTAARLLYRRIASSTTSPTSNTARREVLIEMPVEVLHVDATELAPEILDEDGEPVEDSTEPQAIPHKHAMVKAEPPINRIAHRELRILVWSDGRPDNHHAGITLPCSMAIRFARRMEEGEEGLSPEFRGDVAASTGEYPDP